MEKSRHSKSTVAAPHHPLPLGTKQDHKQRQLPNLSPDSGSYDDRVVEKDSFSFKFGWRSSKQLLGTPIKKLLAEEMSPRTESKRRSPGVIARLMGLDGLPFQQPANKQHKGLQENHMEKTAQLEKTRSTGMQYDGRSSRRSSKDQQEFKDVFEVSEIPKVESSRYSLHGCADLNTADADMSFIEQKFMDAKRLATYQDLQSSKDFRDTLEVLDSNKDLLLKYFKRPDSLFKKHLNDLQAAPCQSHFGHVEAMSSRRYEHDFNWRTDGEKTQSSYNRSHQKHHDGFPCHCEKRHVMHSSSKASKPQFKGRYEQDAVPRKIVVLKPNLGKVQDGTRIVSSPCPHNFLSERGNDSEFSDVRFRDAELYHTTYLPNSARSLRHNTLESREIAKEITRQMKNSLNNGYIMLPSSGFRGYAADDSSCNVSGNEFPEESEETTATLGNSFDLNNCSRRSSHSRESSVSREAKKRLSERWKVTHKSQEVQAISRSNTLADMLAIPDKERKAAKFDSKCSGEGFHDKFSPNGEPAQCVEPLGISSRDGWKDGCIGSLPRSKSLPSSSTAFGSPRTFLRAEALRDDRFMLPKETHKRERRRAARSLDHRHGVNTRSTKSGHKKSWSLYSSNLGGNEFSPALTTIQNKMVSLEEDSPELVGLATESFAETLRDTSAVTDEVVDVANENAVGSSEPSPDNVLPELSSCVLIKGDSSAVDKDNSLQQDLSTQSSGGSSAFLEPPVPEIESTCCKDADQPSPVSVLEPSFTDDVSSCSECFESLSADLQGLRMQLQLLKMESEECVEGPMLISSDEDGVDASTGTLENNELRRTKDSWASCYIIDVLSESGIDGAEADAVLEAWHSLDSPVSLSVFEELEKRYCDWTTCSRPERRLLFDRINSGILKIHESMYSQPWVGPTTTNVGSKLIKNGLEDGLFRMLGSHGKVKDDALGNVLVGESEWLDLKDDIDVIGREVERLLLDDLMAEIVGV